MIEKNKATPKVKTINKWGDLKQSLRGIENILQIFWRMFIILQQSFYSYFSYAFYLALWRALNKGT